MSPEEIHSLAKTAKIISDLAASKPNEWVPVYAALGGALAGALVSFFPTWFLEKRRERLFARKVEKAILSEVAALLEIIEHRKYVGSIEDIVEELRTSSDKTITLEADIPDHYSRIYQANCENIGVISPEIARDVITFYQLIDAVVQDLKNGGGFSSGATLNTYEETLSIFKKAINVGEKITRGY